MAQIAADLCLLNLLGQLAERSTTPVKILKLSTVKILPKAADQRKKLTFGGTFGFHMVFQGKESWVLECRTL